MKKKKTILISNRKAFYNYEILEEFVAGISLLGCEVKSIRNSRASIKEAFCYIKKGEAWIKKMHVTKYEFENSNEKLDEIRDRKLLLKRKEINKLSDCNKEGKTIVPLNLFFSKKGLVKLKIALVKGKKLYDKRRSIKERELDRKLRNFKN